MNFLTTMLSGMSGEPSSIRGAMFLVILFVGTLKGIATYKTGVMPPWTFEEVGLICAAMGIKTWQRGKESPPSPVETIPAVP